MKNYFDLVKDCPLFKDINEVDLRSLLKCLSSTEKHYNKNNYIFNADEEITLVGVVLYGCVHILKEDFWGKRTILTRIESGELFGEAFSCSQTDSFPVSIIAAENTGVLMIDYKRLIKSCSSDCTFHNTLIKNMLIILAGKNIMLMQKIEHITRNTTRDKLLSYLSSQALTKKSSSFTIPFNRQELADYLSVDRSAMSAELCRMRDDGLLRFNKNRFELLE